MHGRKSVLAFLVYLALSSWPVGIYTDIVLCCLSCRWVHIDVSTGGDPCPISTSHPVSADGSCQRMQQQVAAVRLACRWVARSLFGGSCICRQLTSCHLAAVCFRCRPASHMHTLRVDIDISTTSPQSSRQHLCVCQIAPLHLLCVLTLTLVLPGIHVAACTQYTSVCHISPSHDLGDMMVVLNR